MRIYLEEGGHGFIHADGELQFLQQTYFGMMPEGCAIIINVAPGKKKRELQFSL